MLAFPFAAGSIHGFHLVLALRQPFTSGRSSRSVLGAPMDKRIQKSLDHMHFLFEAKYFLLLHFQFCVSCRPSATLEFRMHVVLSLSTHLREHAHASQ